LIFSAGLTASPPRPRPALEVSLRAGQAQNLDIRETFLPAQCSQMKNLVMPCHNTGYIDIAI